MRVRGILSAATTDGEVSIALRQAVYLAPADPTPKPSLIINARDLLEVEASDVVLDPSPSSSSSASKSAPHKDSFRTDTDISGLPPPSRPRERDLQAWSAGADAWGAGGIEDSTSNGIGGLSLDDDFAQKPTNGKRGGPAGGSGAWDQFAANERMYGLKTDYDEEIYTTKLDRSTKDFKDREARAAQLEKEILKVRPFSLDSLVADAELPSATHRVRRVSRRTLTWPKSEENKSTMVMSTRKIGQLIAFTCCKDDVALRKPYSPQIRGCSAQPGSLRASRCSKSRSSTSRRCDVAQSTCNQRQLDLTFPVVDASRGASFPHPPDRSDSGFGHNRSCEREICRRDRSDTFEDTSTRRRDVPRLCARRKGTLGEEEGGPVAATGKGREGQQAEESRSIQSELQGE